MAGFWMTVSTPLVGTDNLCADTMLLLTDGSVLVHQLYWGYDGSVWMRLTPDSAGNYITGIWTGPFKMITQREDFASGILADGRVYVVGGEYSNDTVNADPDGNMTGGDTPLGEIFDPVHNVWSPMNKPSTFNYIRGDIASSGLADGRVLFGSLTLAQSAVWNPAQNTWKEVGKGSKDGITDEETWTLLPDGSVLTVEVTPSTGNKTSNPSERYVPDGKPDGDGRWVPAGGTGQPLVVSKIDCAYTPIYNNQPQTQSVNVSEIGPALVLPDGRLFAIGATGYTTIYSLNTNTWAPGPSFPRDTSLPDGTNDNTFTDAAGNICAWTSPTGLQGAADAPAVLLPGGQVLCSAGNFQPSVISNKYNNSYIELDDRGNVKSFFNTPTYFYEYDSAQNVLVSIPSPPGMGYNWTWMGRLLLLPNGQVLYSENSTMLSFYQPSAAELTPAVARPTITNFNSVDFPSTLTIGKTFKLTGKNLNGFSQANSYGDDAQMATNFPLVQITNTTTKQVGYLRTHNFSSLGVAVAGPVSCDVDVPGTGVPPGTWTLVVIANAVPSLPVTVQIGQPKA
jgi:hypothetical protein